MESHKERDAQRWTGTNLKTEGVMIVPKSNLMFVDIGHPVFEYSVDDADETFINRLGFFSIEKNLQSLHNHSLSEHNANAKVFMFTDGLNTSDTGFRRNG